MPKKNRSQNHHHHKQENSMNQTNLSNPALNETPVALGMSFDSETLQTEETFQDRTVSRETSADGRPVRSSREEEERINQSRQFLQNLYPDRLYFPSDEIPQDMDYRWIREEFHGTPDMARVTVMTRKGWTPVPASRHPNFLSDCTWTGAAHKEDIIRVQGLILCERPKELGLIENKTLKSINEINKTRINWQAGVIGTQERRVFENKAFFGTQRG